MEAVHSGVFFLGICRNDGFCIIEFYRLAWTMCKLDWQVMSFCYEPNFMGTNLVVVLAGFFSFTYAYRTPVKIRRRAEGIQQAFGYRVVTFRTTTKLNILRKRIIVLCSISKCLIVPKILTYRVKIKSSCSTHPRRYFFTSYRIEWTMIQIEQTHIGRSMTKCHDSSRLKISSGGTRMLLFYEIYVSICTSVP